MSSLVCTSGECAQGRTSIEEMTATFAQLQSASGFDPSHFEQTVTEIQNTYRNNFSWIDEWIPFNPQCCALKDLGSQADTVTAAMLASVGSQNPGKGPGSTPPPISFEFLVSVGIAFAVAYIFLGKQR